MNRFACSLWAVFLLVVSICIALPGYQPCRAEDAQEDILFWTCSMHPSIRLPDPGKCPVCAMDLIPVDRGAQDDAGIGLKLSETAARLAEIETFEVVKQAVSMELRLPGRVSYDETRIAEVSAWAGGRIERLHVNFTGDYVQKGKPLFTLYSPALNLAQQEYLTVYKRADSTNASSSGALDSARRKLLLLGITSAQIDALERRGHVTDVMDIQAPVSGVVLARDVYEGGYVATGDRMFRIAQLDNVWVELDVYEVNADRVQAGQAAVFTAQAYPAQTFTGRIVYIDPFLDTDTRTFRARMELPNPGMKLKPGMFGHADISCPLGQHLIIPTRAVLLTGKRSLVYVETDALTFEAREVEVLPRAGDVYPVASGLVAGERVVTRGNFKLDASAQIRGQHSMVNLLNASSTGSEQTLCPVMGGPINKNLYTDVKGYRIYVCCPGCTEAIKKDPDTYIEKLRQQGVTPERTPAGSGSDNAVHNH